MIKLQHISLRSAAVRFYQRSDVFGSELVPVAPFDQLIDQLFAVVVKEDVPDGFCHASEIAFYNVVIISFYQIEVGRNVKSAAFSLAVKNGLARADSDGWVSSAYIFDHFDAFRM